MVAISQHIILASLPRRSAATEIDFGVFFCYTRRVKEAKEPGASRFFLFLVHN